MDNLLHIIKYPCAISYWYDCTSSFHIVKLIVWSVEVHDEMSLPNGVLRLKPKRGHGHHNGVKSVMEHLDGCHQFPRLCIGIGNPPGAMDMKAFLLQKFSETNINYLYVGLSLGVKHKPVLVEI
nr:chloroplastic group IIB intron splicing facilitator CRS2-B, chloroplastic [Ipomoea batatas]